MAERKGPMLFFREASSDQSEEGMPDQQPDRSPNQRLNPLVEGSLGKQLEDTSSPSLDKPLAGLLVVDFSQFLSGPSAALRMADLGARVIKVERPESGDICRSLYITNVVLDGDSSLFHAINRNKEGIACDLKDPADLEFVRHLIQRADVLVQNFRPGVMTRIGLDYASVQELNPTLVYAEITGYGQEGPWKEKPGQDLLVQSLSGLPWSNGGDDSGSDSQPVPFGLSIADMAAGALLVQGVLACLVRRGSTGRGGHVEVSLMEAVLDAQAEGLNAFLNAGVREPACGDAYAAHALRPAPCGVYATSDGYLAIGITDAPLAILGELIGCDELVTKGELNSLSAAASKGIRQLIAGRLRTASTAEWICRLERSGWPCAEVLEWPRLMESEAFLGLGMTQMIVRDNGCGVNTTRCPIRIDGNRLFSAKGAPRIDEHGTEIRSEFRIE